MKYGKQIISTVLVTTILTSNAMAASNVGFPQNGVVVGGAASIDISGTTMNVNQTTQRADINWNSFNIANGKTVDFKSANSSDITINKVIGNEASVIDGMLKSNHIVAVVTEKGLLITKNAKINTGAFLATTAKNYKVGKDDFGVDNIKFSDFGSGEITNLGEITVKNGGNIGLFANKVTNGTGGSITANGGSVHLANGGEVSVRLKDGFSYSTDVTAGTTFLADGGINNSGTITAKSGIIALTDKNINTLRAGTIYLPGVVDATAIGPDGFMLNTGGMVNIEASGDINTTGSIDVADYYDANKEDSRVALTAGKTNNFSGSIKTTNNPGTAKFKSDTMVEIAGNDLIYNGNIQTNGMVSIATKGDLLITQAQKPVYGGQPAPVVPNSISETALENMGKNASYIELQGKNVAMQDLRDNNLDINSTLEVLALSSSQNDGTLVFADKNDTIRSNKGNVRLLADNNVDIGNVYAGGSLGVSSVHGSVKANKLETGSYNVNSGIPAHLISLNSRMNFINDAMKPDVGIQVNQIVMNADSTTGPLQVALPGQVPATNSLEIQSKGFANIGSVDMKAIGLNAQNNVEVAADQVDFGNTKILAQNNQPGGYANSFVDIRGNDIVTHDMEIKNISDTFDSSHFGVTITPKHTYRGLGVTSVSAVDTQGRNLLKRH